MSIERAQVWLQQGRADRAEGELREALAEQPDDAMTHALLSLCLLQLERATEAEAEARAAVTAAPDYSVAHYAIAAALEAQGKLAEARRAIGEAIRIDPEDADHWAALGQIELDDRRWAEALEAAERGLALDPDAKGCNNVRAIALGQLGRGQEAREQIDRALARDPEDPQTHANAGWRLLQAGQVDEAGKHFRESLRLAPGNEAARAGMIEALKAGNPLYRRMLAFFMWMGRLPRRQVWMVLILLFLLPRLLNKLSRDRPELAPFLMPVAGIIVLFVYLTWIIDPLFDASLLLHPLGRHALTVRERRRALAVTICLGAGVACLVCAPILHMPFVFPAMVFLSFVIPLSAALGVSGDRRRRRAVWMAVGIGATAVIALLLAALGVVNGESSPLLVAAVSLIFVYLAGIMALTLMTNRWSLDPRDE